MQRIAFLMKQLDTRKIKIFDMMLLIVSIAISLWLSRSHLSPVLYALHQGFDSKIWAANPLHLSWNWGSLILRDLQPIAAVSTFTVLMLTFLQPRPCIRRVARRPGFMACLGATLAILVGGILNIQTMGGTPAPGYRLLQYTEAALLPHGSEPGLAIAACWLMLALMGRWRLVRNWIDRSGMALGVYWLVMIFVNRLGTGA
jgi:hypothetical protein